MKKFLSLLFINIITLLSWTNHVWAQPATSVTGTTGGTSATGQTQSPGININLKNPFNGSDSLSVLLENIINNILLPIGGILAVLAFIYSGFLYVTAQGDESKIKTAHKALLYTSIGTAVLLGSWVIARLICNTITQIGGPACIS